MKTAIRLIVSVVMAAATAPVFADGSDAMARVADSEQGVHPVQTSVKTDVNTDDSNVGGGSREPSTSDDARATERASPTGAAAIEEYSRQKFLEQTWMAAP